MGRTRDDDSDGRPDRVAEDEWNPDDEPAGEPRPDEEPVPRPELDADGLPPSRLVDPSRTATPALNLEPAPKWLIREGDTRFFQHVPSGQRLEVHETDEGGPDLFNVVGTDLQVRWDSDLQGYATRDGLPAPFDPPSTHPQINDHFLVRNREGETLPKSVTEESLRDRQRVHDAGVFLVRTDLLSGLDRRQDLDPDRLEDLRDSFGNAFPVDPVVLNGPDLQILDGDHRVEFAVTKNLPYLPVELHWPPTADRINDLSAYGHAHDRHGGHITQQQLRDRVEWGIDPASGTTTDAFNGQQHRVGRHATKFATDGAFVRALDHVRFSPEFEAERQFNEMINQARVAVTLPLEQIFGPGYRSEVEGWSRIGSKTWPIGNPSFSQPFQPTNFTDGVATAVFIRGGDGVYRLLTMYPDVKP